MPVQGPLQTLSLTTPWTFTVPGLMTKSAPPAIWSVTGNRTSAATTIPFDIPTRTFTYTPVDGDEGSGTIVVTATNPSTLAFDTYTFNFIINPVNAAPGFAETSPLDTVTWYRGEALDYELPQVNAGYPLPPTYTVSLSETTQVDLPEGISFSVGDDGIPKLVSTSITAAVSTGTIYFTATIPSVGSATLQLPYTIASRTVQWFADSLEDQTAAIGQPFQYTIPPVDEGAIDAQYESSALPPGVIFDPENLIIYGIPTTEGTTTITITARGPDGIPDGITVLLNIAPSTVRVDTQDYETLEAAGNIRPRGLSQDGTNMYVSDDVHSRIFAYLQTTKAHNETKDYKGLLEDILLAPSGVYVNNAGDRTYIADNVSKVIFTYKTSTQELLTPETFYLIEAGANNWEIGDITGDGTHIYIVYTHPANKVARFNIANRDDFDNNYITGRDLPTGLGRFGLYGITLSTNFVWLSNTRGDKANSVIWLSRADLNTPLRGVVRNGFATLSVDSTVTPTINHAFDIPATELRKAFTGRPNAMAYHSSNNTLYIASGTTLYGFEARTSGGRDFYRKDATKDIDASGLGVTSIGSTASDGTGILMITNLGIKGINLDGTTYTARDVPRATLDTLAGTGARSYNIAFHGTETYFVVGRNGPTEVKAVYVFRGTARYSAADIPGSVIRAATEAEFNKITFPRRVRDFDGTLNPETLTFDYNQVRFQGATATAETLYLYDRLYRFAIAIRLSDKTYDPVRSLSRDLLTEYDSSTRIEERNLQGYSMVFDGLGLRVAGDGNVGVFGFQFDKVDQPAESIEAIETDGTNMWFTKPREIKIEATTVPTINLPSSP